jgi:hypothetical protein
LAYRNAAGAAIRSGRGENSREKVLYSPRSPRIAASAAFLYANYIIKIVLVDLKLTTMVSYTPERITVILVRETRTRAAGE